MVLDESLSFRLVGNDRRAFPLPLRSLFNAGLENIQIQLRLRRRGTSSSHHGQLLVYAVLDLCDLALAHLLSRVSDER